MKIIVFEGKHLMHGICHLKQDWTNQCQHIHIVLHTQLE